MAVGAIFALYGVCSLQLDGQYPVSATADRGNGGVLFHTEQTRVGFRPMLQAFLLRRYAKPCSWSEN
jgi:hypothetical protein